MAGARGERESCAVVAQRRCLVKPPSGQDCALSGHDPQRTRQMIRLADGVVFDHVVPIFNLVTSTAKDSNGA
jgi:hypothetical protein